MLMLITLAVYAMALSRGSSEQEARALTYTTLILGNLGLILSNRSWSRTIVATLRSKNVALWVVTGGAFVFLGLILYVPFLRELFSLANLNPVEIAVCVVAAFISIAWFEIFKLLQRKGNRQEKVSVPDNN